MPGIPENNMNILNNCQTWNLKYGSYRDFREMGPRSQASKRSELTQNTEVRKAPWADVIRNELFTA